MSSAQPDTGQQLLDAAYSELELSGDDLIATASSPSDGLPPAQWLNKGEWLMLGERMGAEKVFFVEDDPVIIFSTLPPGAGESDIVATYRRAWSMGRVGCLFLALEGELRVYALNTPPPRALEEHEQLSPLRIVERAADVSEALASYHRDRLVSGLLFGERDYLARSGRADERLLHDVAVATDTLEEKGLPRRAAHALIERVILIRYLEDRAVIGADYFREVAELVPAWLQALTLPSRMPSLGGQSTFVSCLSDSQLTYAVFEKLADTFNGDMFIVEDSELQNVRQEHLNLIQRMLTGAGVDGQEPLFLWAYDFSVVPTSLISSIYEQFYQAGAEDDTGTHYTPPELVEYVIAQTLTPEILNRKPRICDPACGSGVFLVEAFRRLVRNEMGRVNGRLNSAQLLALLRECVSGIDINPEAIRLAAFSLYLAYLNYQEPPDINAAGPLPKLIYRPGDSYEPVVLVVGDAFNSLASETLPISEPSSSASDNGQLRKIFTLPWREGSFDLIIGNPPWDEPRGIPPTTAELWARRNNLAFGDRSKSQLFMWRALSFLKPSGTAALLVAATAFHNVRSKRFRTQWLNTVNLVSFTDFTSARHMFFRSGTAPFALVTFVHRLLPEIAPGRLTYRNVRPSNVLNVTRSMAFAKTERRWVHQNSLRSRDYLWKTYAWGSHRDAAFMARLDAEKQLDEILPEEPASGWGYQYSHGKGAKRKEASNYLKSIPSLSTFEIWGPIQPSWFEDPPNFVGRWPDERRYSGQRILITEGVRAGFGPNARLVTDHYSFRHKIYCVPLPGFPEWQAKSLLGVFLSSLGRYRLFMRSGSWGLWHDKVNAEDILAMPVRFGHPDDLVTRRIVDAIDRLTMLQVQREVGQLSFYDNDDRVIAPTVAELLSEINEAVFDLFDCSPAERDLVNDFHAYTLDIAGNWRKSSGLESFALPGLTEGTVRDISQVDTYPIREYLDRFLGEWNEALKPEGEFSWKVVGAPRSELIGAIFESRGNDDEQDAEVNSLNWDTLLQRLAVSMSLPMAAAVGTDGVLRSVSDTSIVVIKRREARLWSASAAREDAEATMLQAMQLQED